MFQLSCIITVDLTAPHVISVYEINRNLINFTPHRLFVPPSGGTLLNTICIQSPVARHARPDGIKFERGVTFYQRPNAISMERKQENLASH